MNQLFDELESVVTSLNQDTDRLNEVIRDFEDKLETIGVGMEVWLEHDASLEYQLGYAKIDGRWCVAVASEIGPGPRALTSMSRKVRAAATGSFPALLETMRLVAKSRLDDVRAAIENVKRVL